MIMKMKKQKNKNNYLDNDDDLFLTEDFDFNKNISKSLNLPKINLDNFKNFNNNNNFETKMTTNIKDLKKSINLQNNKNFNDNNEKTRNIKDDNIISKRFNENNKKYIGRRDTSLNKEIIKDMDKIVGINEEKEKDEKKKLENDERQIFILYEENDEIDELDSEELNNIAQIVLDRIQDKLSGTDFKPDIIYDVKNQVNELIKSATSYENLAQSYLGWCPFW